MPATAPILQWILVCITWNSQTTPQKRLWGKNFWLPPVKKDFIWTNNLHNLYLLYVIILKNRIQKYERNREKTEIKPQRICNSIMFLSILLSGYFSSLNSTIQCSAPMVGELLIKKRRTLVFFWKFSFGNSNVGINEFWCKIGLKTWESTSVQ